MTPEAVCPPATLLSEVRGAPGAARWSRLYRTAEGYLELTCYPEAVEGQLYPAGAASCGALELRLEVGGEAHAARLEGDGRFALGLRLPPGAALTLRLARRGQLVIAA